MKGMIFMQQTIRHAEPLILSSGGTKLLLNDSDRDILTFDAKDVETAYIKDGQCTVILKRQGRYTQKLAPPSEPTEEQRKTQEMLDSINNSF